MKLQQNIFYILAKGLKNWAFILKCLPKFLKNLADFSKNVAEFQPNNYLWWRVGKSSESWMFDWIPEGWPGRRGPGESYSQHSLSLSLSLSLTLALLWSPRLLADQPAKIYSAFMQFAAYTRSKTGEILFIYQDSFDRSTAFLLLLYC